EHGTRLAKPDELGRLRDGLEAGAAEPVHRKRRRLDGATGAKPDVACEIDGVGGSLLCVADDDVAHIRSRESAAIDGAFCCNRAEIGGGEVLQRAAERAEA